MEVVQGVTSLSYDCPADKFRVMKLAMLVVMSATHAKDNFC